MIYVALGSNMGVPKTHIEVALKEMASFCQILRVAPLYETPALLPPEAQESWNCPFLNTVAEIQFSGTPLELMSHLQNCENKLGRPSGQRWSPRTIDLDILLWHGNRKFDLPNLTIPHPRIFDRAFVLDPLKDLLPSYVIPAASHQQHAPLWMGIYNLTPDSFSDGGQWGSMATFSKKIKNDHATGVQIFDFGAESTRPGATIVESEEEWHRLEPYIDECQRLFFGSPLGPIISVDTRNAKVAERSIEKGAKIINDVSGLKDPNMISILKNSEASYVLMHSLDIPVNPSKVLSSDPIKAICQWLEDKSEIFEKNNIPSDRIFFDPGIGFGKNSIQSLEILKNIKIFRKFPFRILVGASRKSFMNSFSPPHFKNRDLETLGTSLNLIRKGVDVLRVHNPEMHIRAFRGWSHIAG